METAVVPFPNEPYLELLRRCGGYYECPRGSDGQRLGPLVGYTGRYGSEHLQYVGDVYINFAKAERHGLVLARVAADLVGSLDQASLTSHLTGFCGAPEGGKALAVAMALKGGRQYLSAEKKVVALATAAARERTKLVFGRHAPEQDERWIIVEDICNNFSTTKELVELVEQHGAQVTGIACFWNRSPNGCLSVEPRPGLILPIISLICQPIAEYQQDDPAVAADVQSGKVAWKPKDEWPRLAAAMSQTGR